MVLLLLYFFSCDCVGKRSIGEEGFGHGRRIQGKKKMFIKCGFAVLS